MSETALPRFARTGGGNQKFATQKSGLENSISKEGSGVSAFFKTLKKKLSKQESMSPKTASQTTTKFTPADKSYYIKATLQGTVGRNFAQVSQVHFPNFAVSPFCLVIYTSVQLSLYLSQSS